MAIDPNAAAAAALGLPTSALSSTSSSSTPSISSVNSNLQNLLTQSQIAVQGAIAAQTATAVDAATAAANAASAGTISGLQSQIAGLQASTSASSAATTTSRQNVFDSLKSMLESWGLLTKDSTGAYDATSQALLSTVQSLAMSGSGVDTISLQLQQSAAYKARFSGNDARIAAGLPALSPADYLATEQSYDQILRAAGVPAGFYSSAAQKAKLIGADISPSELQSRVELAKQSISGADPYYTATLKNLYGLSSGDMIAHVLDPSIAMPLLQQQTGATTVAAEAARAGTAINSSLAQQLAAQGVTQAEATQGFGTVAGQLPSTQTLAARYQGYMPAAKAASALESATFGTNINGQTAAQSEAELKRLQTQEVSQFSGSAGASSQAQSLGIGNAQGAS
jgi:hypothetical protein